MADTPLNVNVYLEYAARVNSPENWANRLRKIACSPWVYIPWGIALIGTLVYLDWYKDQVNHVFRYASGPVFLLSLAAFVVVSAFALPAAWWRRYSMFHALQRYPTFCSASWDDITSIRAADPYAEFELAILEREGHAFGAVLYQVVDDTRRLPVHSSSSGTPDFPEEWKQGWPIRIFDGNVRPVSLRDGLHFYAAKQSI